MAKPKKENGALGPGRYVRFSAEEWQLVVKWAREMTAAKDVEVTTGEVLRILVRDEGRRRGQFGADLAAVAKG